MKKIRKIFALIIILIFVFTLSGCELLGMGGTSQLDISKNEALKKVEDLGNSTGYEISYVALASNESSTTDSITLKVGQKENVYWIDVPMQGSFAYMLKDNCVLLYEKNNEGYKYIEAYAIYDGETKEKYMTNFSLQTFLQAFSYSSKLEKKGEETIADRLCTVYQCDITDTLNSIIGSFVGDALENGKVTYTYYVDNELGITLKALISAETELVNGQARFEVTNFDLNPTAPELEVPEVIEPLNVDHKDVVGGNSSSEGENQEQEQESNQE